jgi:hypothetical protein
METVISRTGKKPLTTNTLAGQIGYFLFGMSISGDTELIGWHFSKHG